MTISVGIDIDDVLFPWYDKAHQACVAAGITNGVQPVTWSPFDEYGCGLQPWLDALEVVTLDRSLYTGDPFPGAVEAVRQLKDAGYYVHLITARGYFKHGELIRETTREWVADHRIPHDTLTFSKDKTVLWTDFFVDDNVKNCRALQQAGTSAYLMRRPWNHDAVDLPSVHSLGDFADIVIKETTCPTSTL